MGKAARELIGALAKAGAEDRKLKDLLRANRHLKRQLDRRADALDVFRRVVREAVAPLPPWRPRPARPDPGRGQPEAAVGLFSDLQAGTLVRPADTAGIGRWGRADCARAMDAWRDTVLRIVQVQRADHPVDELVLLCLGDYVEGEGIYRGQAWHLDMDLTEQITWGAATFARAVREMAERGRFQRVRLYMLAGNHGRLGKPGQIRANADDLFVAFVRQQLAASAPAIQVVHSASPIMAVQFFGRWNFVMTHGHETRSWMTIPFYGLERDGFRQVSLLRLPVHYKVCGHHHQPAEWDLAPDLTVMVNGCWPGPTGYSVGRLSRAVTPKQWLFFLHPTRGRTALYDIRLGRVAELRAGRDGVFTPVREEG